MKRKSKELLQYKTKNFYLHDELDLCCEDLTKKKELKTSQCLSNEEENFIAVVTLA